MWRIVAVGVLLVALLVAVVAMSGCPKQKSGEEIEAEMREQLGTGAPPPPPPPPGHEAAEGAGEQAAPATPPAGETQPAEAPAGQ